MNTQFKKGILEMCILSLISEHDMYGFEIIDKLAHAIDVNENTVYPILRRLTQQGFFETYEKQTNVGAPRKYYQITDSGHMRFKKYQKDWSEFLKGVYQILGGHKDER
ncbi:MAG: PadR family transcriptional regulator [Acholeplasmataceae bacterium]